MSLHVEESLLPYLCGYRKTFSTQQALLSLLEKWKKILEKKKYGGAVLIINGSFYGFWYVKPWPFDS